MSQDRLAHQDKVSAFGKEVQCQSAFNDVAFDFGGPGPFEVGHGFESLDSRQT